MHDTRVSALAFRGIGKSFFGHVANDAIDLDIAHGEIHAILGENGAGKSTLMNIASGLYQPDCGTLAIDGHEIQLRGPLDARDHGIGMVHQHFKLVSRFTVAENIHLGERPTPQTRTHKGMIRRTEALAQQFGLPVRADAIVSTLSAGEQQRCEILRVLARGARILILDEPTAVLGPDEVTGLFAALRRLRAAGGTVILISHKLDEVMALADRVSVLRQGRLIGTWDVARTTIPDLVAAMIGRATPLDRSYPRTTIPETTETILSLRGTSLRDAQGTVRLHPFDLDVHRGEILGIAGVTGNGQAELARLLTGLASPSSGTIACHGRDLTGQGARIFAKNGIGHVPEDRLRHAIAATAPIVDNAALREYDRAPIGGGQHFVRRAAAAFARDLAQIARVSLRDVNVPVAALSGGNQQRLVLARELRIASRVLVASYPSRGLDVGAIAEMRVRLAQCRDEGLAIVLMSEDLDELLALSDRIAVLCAGRLTSVLDRPQADHATIGMLMSGGTVRGEAA